MKFVSIFMIHPHTEFLMPKLNMNFSFFQFNVRGSIYVCNGTDEQGEGTRHRAFSLQADTVN